MGLRAPPPWEPTPTCGHDRNFSFTRCSEWARWRSKFDGRKNTTILFVPAAERKRCFNDSPPFGLRPKNTAETCERNDRREKLCRLYGTGRFVTSVNLSLFVEYLLLLAESVFRSDGQQTRQPQHQHRLAERETQRNQRAQKIKFCLSLSNGRSSFVRLDRQTQL